MNMETVTITIDTDSPIPGFNSEESAAFAKLIINAMNEPDTEVSISLINDEEMKLLNHQYRGVAQPTDVLSFSMREGEPVGSKNILGDIVISYNTAARQAADFGHGLQTEINELIFHGMLHLYGYDHEWNAGEWRQQETLLIQSLKKMKSAYIPLGMQTDHKMD